MSALEYFLESVFSCFGSLNGLLSLGRLPGGVLIGEEINIGGRRFKITSLLGEGGYSFVYEAQEVTSSSHSETEERFAIKKVLAATREQVEAATHEVAVMESLHHPNLLSLVASSIVPYREGHHVVYMLFPLYQDGSLMDEVTLLAKSGRTLAPQDLLSIFIQVCHGVQAMHEMDPPLAHRDLKPHNILLQRWRRDGGSAGPVMSRDGDLESQPLRQGGEAQGMSQGRGSARGQFHAVVMDFGSTRPARCHIHNRLEALALQEDAEAHCSAPYRAPELFDVASQCSVDERMDVWSLGCVLYFMMYGVSPFERVLGEAGGSLALAVINGRLSWPQPDPWPEPLREQLHALISTCLNTNASARPTVKEIMRRAERLLDDIA